MYLIMVAIVALFAIFGYLDRKVDCTLFCIEILILGVMLCLRYGQGTDYFGYEVNYSLVPNRMDLNFLFHNDVHGEIGYTFIVMMLKSLGTSFPVFVGIWSFVMMLMTCHGIKQYAGIKTVAILLLYPTYYMTFYYAIRQGFGLALTLGFILPAYIRNEKVKYIILVLMGASVHKSVIILLIPLFVSMLIEQNEKLILVAAIVCAVTFGSYLKMSGLQRGYFHYDPSYAAILLRIILFLIIRKLYRFYEKENEINKRLYAFYLVGFCIYISLCPVAFISHRLTAYMKIAEIILIPRLLGNMNGVMIKRWKFVLLKRYVVLFLVAIYMIEGTKNINSYIKQGEYYSNIHVYNYPYVSIFNKKDIYKYRYNEFYDVYPDVFSYVNEVR